MIKQGFLLKNEAEIDGFTFAIAKACAGSHITRVAILSAHINELRFYYLCAVPLGAGFLSVTFCYENKMLVTIFISDTGNGVKRQIRINND